MKPATRTPDPPAARHHRVLRGAVAALADAGHLSAQDFRGAAPRDQPRQQRSTSATLHACAMQPRGVYGSSASKISAMLPTPNSSRWSTRPLQHARAPARRPGWQRSHASMNGPISQPQTVPWWYAASRARRSPEYAAVVGVPRRERAQPDRREQPFARPPPALRSSARCRAPDGPAQSRRAGSAGTRVIAVSPSTTSYR
jgi:hypothetical protein